MGRYRRRDLVGIKYLVIHHSGTDVDSSAQDIARYHVDVLGWPGIGYHYVVRWDGTIEQTLSPHIISYNVAGRNHEVLGICCPGDYTNQPGRAAQVGAKDWLVDMLLTTILPNRRVLGHRQIALPDHPTACPGMLV